MQGFGKKKKGSRIMKEVRKKEELYVVSVIVPIYNTEKYLGYCLNSISSQTYSNLEIILIDDESTDKSLEICHQYGALDPRFHVFTVPNGGVSKARNIGIKKATGRFITFLDSDDVLAADAVEKMLAAAVSSGKDIVFSDILMVDFDAPQGKKIKLSSDYLQRKMYIMDGEEFQDRLMRLIWHTSLLEGMPAKLYNRTLMEETHVQCPEDLSLGEDFVANMKYYSVCNGAVFLGEVEYYYNNTVESESLTHKYRPDLFENKMFLIERLKEHLEPLEQRQSEEIICFYNYVTTTGLRCVESVVADTKNLSTEKKRETLKKIFNNDLFCESMQKASYIDSRYTPWKKSILDHDVEKILSTKCLEENPEIGRGILNRSVRKLLHIAQSLSANEKCTQRLKKLEEEIYRKGIRTVIQELAQQS